MSERNAPTPDDSVDPHAHLPGRRRAIQAAVLALTGRVAGWACAAEAADSTQPLAASSPSRGLPMYAYVGSRTTRERNARGDGISVFKVDPVDASLERTQLVDGLVNPSYLLFSRDGRFLYTVHGDVSSVSAFRVDRASGRLVFINRQETQGENPVHLALDPRGRFLIVANHLGSSLAVLPVGEEGALLPLAQRVRLEGPPGPHRVEQTKAKPHFVAFDPSGRFLLVPDKGTDRIFSFRFERGSLAPAARPFVTTREGAGPRHLAFHPHRPLAYVVNELDSTVTTYRLQMETGALEPIHRISTLPDTYTGDSRASGIVIDRAGKTLYASNRGHDSISVFVIDHTTGWPRLAQAQASGGAKPRDFALAPNGRLLFALNEDSDTLVSFAVDEHTGGLSPTGLHTTCGSPVCMIFSVQT